MYASEELLMLQLKELSAPDRIFRELRAWVKGRLGSVEHECRVADVASALFGLTRPLHGLGGRELKLLRLAAMVHDVGRCISAKGHARRGAEMIEEDLMGVIPAGMRRALAFLTRYHRGSVPERGEEKILNDEADRGSLWVVLGLLRAADALDGRLLESPRLLFALHERRLHIAVYLENDCPRAHKVYARRKKFMLLEEELGCQVEVDVRFGEVLRMVA
jgi:exopolyphosphatase/guanosine-5'-triphosphate,3'-diphosphate pyrophosphatase